MIAVDTTSIKDWLSSGVTHTWSHTCSGSNRLLVVASFCTANLTISGTYNGTNMNSMTSTNVESYTGGNNVGMIALLAPATGANNIVVTFSSSASAALVGVSYTGVRQSSFPDCAIASGAGHNNSSTAVTDTLTTNTDNCWLASAVYDVDNATSITSGTKRKRTGVNTGIDDSNGARTPAGTQTMQWTGTNFRFGAHITIAFAPAATGQTISISDAITLSESPSTLRGLKTSILDTLNLAGNINSLRNRLISISDNIGLTGVLTATRNIILSVSDTIGLTEFISWLNGKVISVSDAIGLDETLNTIKSFFISVSDIIGLTGTITTIKTYIISVSDDIGLTEGISIIRNLIVRISDSIGLTELLVTIYKSFYKTPPIQINVELNTAQTDIELETANSNIDLNTANIDIEAQSGSAAVNL